MRPDVAIQQTTEEIVARLKDRCGAPRVERILDGGRPEGERSAPPTGTEWIRRANVVGINIRTVGSFWKAVAYVLTLPRCQNAIHLLPFWEPGVVASLYGMASWEINPEFLDQELAKAYPALRTPFAQLQAAVRAMHLLGKRVGLDVVPHTDRFSEIVLCNPSFFEWIKRDRDRLVGHRTSFWKEAQAVIERYLVEAGSATGKRRPAVADGVMTESRTKESPVPPTPNASDPRVLFGPPEEPQLRLARRQKLIDRLYAAGLETAPATMGPPYRGLEIDPESGVTDAAGRTWYDYRFLNPTPASRAFGPLTRYAFYETVDDNEQWQLDFTRPRDEIFSYLATHIDALVTECGFDFMRGDMSHVQMRPGGVPVKTDLYYDPHGFVKLKVGEQRPGFAYFAESFLAPPGTMAYGDEIDHLEASGAEVTLGDLQSVPVRSNTFAERLVRYIRVAETRSLTPSLTVMTGDKDDPRFDSFYRSGGPTRLFLALFVPDMPSYMALGFELRDEHTEPVGNEYYSKLYVFQERSGPKSTTGPYRFGRNVELFHELQRVRSAADGLADRLAGAKTQWVRVPEPDSNAIVAWQVTAKTVDAPLLCIANLDTDRNNEISDLWPDGSNRSVLFRSNSGEKSGAATSEMSPGECRVYG